MSKQSAPVHGLSLGDQKPQNLPGSPWVAAVFGGCCVVIFSNYSGCPLIHVYIYTLGPQPHLQKLVGVGLCGLTTF